MVRKRKINQFSSNIYKTETYNNRMVEMVKSMEQWVTDTIEQKKITTKYFEPKRRLKLLIIFAAYQKDIFSNLEKTSLRTLFQSEAKNPFS